MILLMGLPGSGKGTQGKMMADQEGMHLVSMGDLVRLYVTGARREQMLAGALLDDTEVIAIVDRVLATIPADEECVLDGFPRTIPQAEWLQAQVETGRFIISHIFFLVASEQAVRSRLKARGRADDDDKVIIERFREYERLTKPVLAWLKSHNLVVTEIDAERMPAAVNEDILRHLHHES